MIANFKLNFEGLDNILIHYLIRGFTLIYNISNLLKYDKKIFLATLECDPDIYFELNDKIITPLTFIEILSKDKPILNDNERNNLSELMYYDFKLACQILRNSNIYRSFYLVGLPISKTRFNHYYQIIYTFINIMNYLIYSVH